MPGNDERALRRIESLHTISVSGPRERCRGCGYEDKPAGFRNFCPSCGQYPSEVMVRREGEVR